MPVAAKPAIDRVLGKVAYDHGCWSFMGARNRAGYGVIANPGGPRLVHRVTFDSLVRPLAANEDIDHLCRNPQCCNPLHLEPVSRRENTIRGLAGAQQRARTHCPQGHEYTPENTRLKQPGNRRECRECGREYERRKDAARKAA